MTPLKQAEQVYKTIQSWLGDGCQPVAMEQAQRRADICIQCPHNSKRKIEEVFKGAAIAPIRKMIEAKTKMSLHVKDEERLHICAICDCVLSLKVFIPIEHIVDTTSAETLNDFPSYCFVKTETKEEKYQ